MGKTEILRKLNVDKFCKENNLSYLGLFGSYARNNQSESSDIDLLFEVQDKEKKTLFDIGKMAYFLQKQMGIDVDFVDKKNIRTMFKSSIMSDLTTLY